MIPPTEPKELVTSGGTFPLHEFHLATAGREWTFLHTGVVLTAADEQGYLRETSKHVPYGLALWPSSIALAHDVATRKLAGATVLELGAGTGLPGVVAATLGATVTQTDSQETALALCRINGRRNGASDRIAYATADWTAWPDDGTRYDFLLGADILYGPALHPHLREIFDTRLAPGGTVLLADPFRAASLPFLETLQSAGWRVTFSRWNLGDAAPRAVGVYELTR